jgi:hypothetical protein
MAGKAKCSIDGCDRTVNGHGLCQTHQHRQKVGAPMDTPIRPYVYGRTCEVDGCDKRHEAHGMCKMHLYRWKRRQTVEDADLYPRKAEVGYHAVHKRLMRDIGHPTTLPCVDCGGTGEEWSYVGDCPDEQRQTLRGVQMAYCTHQQHYDVRCVTCHKRYDSAA